MSIHIPRNWLALLIALSALSCGGGGSESTSTVPALPDPDPVNDSGGSTSLAASFVPAAADPAPGSIVLGQEEASGNVVSVFVRVVGGEDVYGAGFDLLYDGDVVEYVGWAPGSLLEVGGNTPIYSVSPQPGKLVVGVSRTGPVAGITGTRKLIVLTFRVTEAGTSPASFDGGFLLDSQLPTPQPIPGLTWHGGQFQAN
jgi:hypothetical protein